MPEIDPNAMQLLMVHADDREPVLPEAGLPGDTAADEGGPAKVRTPEHLWDEGGDPNDLDLQRWSVIAPEGEEGDRLIGAVGELIRARCEQMGIPEIEPYRVPPKMTEAEAARWQKTVFDPGADLSVELPRYLMILGDLHQVPMELQKVLGADAFVGRLAFEQEDDYASYAAKVLRWEGQPHEAQRGRSLFFTVHDGSPATYLGHQALVSPGLEMVRERRERGHFPADEVTEVGDRWACGPDDLLGQVGPAAPSVLFSLSHGLGAPRAGWDSEDERRLRQGAMSFGRDGSLAGEDLASRPFLPGGIWFMLACYGAGTPAASAYHHWLKRLQEAGQFPGQVDFVLGGIPSPGERPFVAALPKAVLANPEGPLAFMGHVDLAFSYSFQELDSGAANRPARFMSILRSALKRDRAGISFRELSRYLTRTNAELTALVDQDVASGAGEPDAEDERARRSHLWMLRQDLSAYMLLGDPAVRLPLSAKQPAAATGAGADMAALLGMAPSSSAAPAAPVAPLGPSIGKATEPPLTVDIETLEEAIGEVLVGERGARAIARDAGIDPARLRQAVDVYRAGGRAALRDRGVV